MKTHRDLKHLAFLIKLDIFIFHENPQGFETLFLLLCGVLKKHFMKTHRDLKLFLYVSIFSGSLYFMKTHRDLKLQERGENLLKTLYFMKTHRDLKHVLANPKISLEVFHENPQGFETKREELNHQI